MSPAISGDGRENCHSWELWQFWIDCPNITKDPLLQNQKEKSDKRKKEGRLKCYYYTEWLLASHDPIILTSYWYKYKSDDDWNISRQKFNWQALLQLCSALPILEQELLWSSPGNTHKLVCDDWSLVCCRCAALLGTTHSLGNHQSGEHAG